MTITALDTHETVKSLTAAGFTDSQAEAVTQALRRASDIDLSSLATKDDVRDMATKADIAELRREMAEIKAETIKWVVGIGFAEVAMILAVLKLFPAGYP